MIIYENDGKIAVFNNERYCRDDKTGYYLNSASRKRLHRVIWEHYNGEIPKGFHIHHKDHDKSNNKINNLFLIKSSKHTFLHGIENAMDDEWMEWSKNNLKNNARPKASEWHKSEEGREWHKKHYQNNKDKMHVKNSFICEFCNCNFEAVITKINRFCSNKCKSAWRRKNSLNKEIRICKSCGKNFATDKYKQQLTCSKKCYNYIYIK